MGILRRAIRNVIRVPGRSLMLGIVFTVVAVLVMFGLSIQAGTQKGIDEARKSLGNEVELTQNSSYAQQKLSQLMSGESSSNVQSSDITESLGKKLTNSKYVKDYSYYLGMSCSGDLDPLTANIGGGNVTSFGNTDTKNKPKFRLIGESNPVLDPDFSNGNKKIKDGRFITADDAASNKDIAVISKTLADKNGLKIGDKFTVQATNTDEQTSLTIVGIYESTESDDVNLPLPTPSVPGNYIYTTYPVARQIDLSGVSNTSSDYVSSVYYYLDDPAHIDEFEHESSSKIDMTAYTLNANDNAYQKMVGPLQKLSGFAKISIITTIIAAAVILILMMTLNIRERKYEVGILRSLGAKRFTVAAQFAAEALIVCSIGLLIGGTVGGIASQSTASYMLNQEVANEQSQQTQGLQMNGKSITIIGEGFADTNPNVQPVDKINAIISIRQLVELISIGLFLVICGSLVSTYGIMKYEPMKILSNRN